MSRARTVQNDTRLLGRQATTRKFPIPSVSPVIFMYVPSKHITLGERIYPFAGFVFDGPSPIASARWRKDGGGYSTISLGVYTDILSAARFVSEVVNIFGTFFYELEVTDEDGNVELIGLDVISAIKIGISKSVERSTNFRPFSDSLIARDTAQIKTIKYSVEGDTTVVKTAIARPVLFSGAHSGSSGSATLTDSGRDFSALGIRVNTDIIKNTTDSSEGVITNISTDTITVTLAGGTDNDWDTSDAYQIVDGETLNLIAQGFELSFSSQSYNKVNFFVTDQTDVESTGFIIVRVT